MAGACLAAAFLVQLVTAAASQRLNETKHLKVGYVEDRPGVFHTTVEGTNRTIVAGFSIDLLKWMSHDLNFTYILMPVDYSDGFTGMARNFPKQSLDMAVTSFGLSHGRNQLLTFLVPYETGTESFIIPYPTYRSDPWSCIRPYTATVWIGIVLSMVGITLLLKLFTTLRHSLLLAKHDEDSAAFASLQNTFMYVMGVVTNQGGYCSSKTRSSRVLAAVWCLAALVLANAYSGSLITYMTTPKLSLLVSSVEDLAARSDLQLLTPDDSFSQATIQAGVGTLSSLATNLARLPGNYCGSEISIASPELATCLQLVKDGRHVLAMDVMQSRMILEDDYQVTRTCRLTLLDKPYYSVYYSFVIPLDRSHEYRNSLDVSVLKALSYGLPSHWEVNSYPPRRSPCFDYEIQTQEMRVLTLTDLSSAFTILGLGYALSFIAFSYEMARKRFKLDKRLKA